MKIFCTGNPERKTIAWGLQQLGPVTSASISNGWDFSNTDSHKRLTEVIKNYSVFVNSAYVNNNTQSILCDLVHNVWTENNISGHVFNIGTTLENTTDTSDYAKSKRLLRDYTQQLSENTGHTGVKFSYLIIGGVGNNYVTPIQIAQTIHWIAQQQIRIPLIQLDSVKT
jgi:short-subunit dehydrogenase